MFLSALRNQISVGNPCFSDMGTGYAASFALRGESYCSSRSLYSYAYSYRTAGIWRKRAA